MSKEINFYLNAVFIIDSVSKQLSFCFQDSSFPLSCLIEMPGYQIKKRRIINAKKIIFLAIFPLDDYHLFYFIFESSFKNTISYN